MSIFEKFTSCVENLRSQVEIFKRDHKMASAAISEIIDSSPFPFNSFGKIVWNGIEKEDDAPQKMLDILERIERNDELGFMFITTNIAKLMQSNATHDDIVDIARQIGESREKIIAILEPKLDQILKTSKESSEKLNEIENVSSVVGEAFGVVQGKPDFADWRRRHDLLVQLESNLTTKSTKKIIIIATEDPRWINRNDAVNLLGRHMNQFPETKEILKKIAKNDEHPIIRDDASRWLENKPKPEQLQPLNYDEIMNETISSKLNVNY